MSEPIRYTQNIKCVEPSYLAQNIQSGMVECSIGEWVLHSDYARLKAEVEQLKEGNDCLGQMHDKEMERSAYLLEEFNRTTAWGRGLESDLSHARVEISFLKADLERLRKAGDRMAAALNGEYNHELPCVEDWNAAKEGKPSA